MSGKKESGRKAHTTKRAAGSGAARLLPNKGFLTRDNRTGLLLAKGKPFSPEKKNGQINMVTLSRDEYNALLARIEDLEDLRDLQAARAAPDREELPSELARRLLIEEKSRVKLWRQHRGLTARALAEKADVAPGYLSEIKTGKKPGSIDAMAKIARALDVLVDDLIDG